MSPALVARAPRLKSQTQSQLNCAATCRSRDLPEIDRRHRSLRSAEVHLVCRIEHLRAKLKPNPFRNRLIAAKAEVEIEDTWIPQIGLSTRVGPERIQRSRRKCRR